MIYILFIGQYKKFCDIKYCCTPLFQTEGDGVILNLSMFILYLCYLTTLSSAFRKYSPYPKSSNSFIANANIEEELQNPFSLRVWGLVVKNLFYGIFRKALIKFTMCTVSHLKCLCKTVS